MDSGYVLLTEKAEMWARMLMQVLDENGILYSAKPVYGAGLVVRTGIPERLQVFVPAEAAVQANELLEELFSAEEK